VRILGALLALVLLSGCHHVRPWERAKLAHPSMTSSPSAGPAEDHVYAIQEGAVGGGGTVESGCGCN